MIASLVVQAVLEEFFFRGYLWAALERHAGIAGTLLATSVLFGLAHVVMGGPLGLERLLPTTLLGLLLGFVRWRTGSVGPGTVQHALHNAILSGVGFSDLARSDSLPWPWLAAASAAAAVALVLLTLPRRAEHSAPSPPGTPGGEGWGEGG